jgi:hypothetical protein
VGNIHKRLKNVHGDETVDHSTVSWWARRLCGESGHTNIWDSPHTGRLHTYTQTPDNVQCALVDTMPQETTINSDAYVPTLKKLQAWLSRVQPHQQKQDVLLLHDITRPHVSQKTKDEIIKLTWTTQSHPPYRPDVAPSGYHLFGKLKESLRRTRFENNNALIMTTKQWLRHASPVTMLAYRP